MKNNKNKHEIKMYSGMSFKCVARLYQNASEDEDMTDSLFAECTESGGDESYMIIRNDDRVTAIERQGKADNCNVNDEMNVSVYLLISKYRSN